MRKETERMKMKEDERSQTHRIATQLLDERVADERHELSRWRQQLGHLVVCVEPGANTSGTSET